MAEQNIVTSISSGAVVAAGAGATYYFTQPAPGSHRVSKAYLVPSAGITADNTNYSTYTLVVAGTTIATEATTLTDLGTLAAGARAELVVSGTPVVGAQGAACSFVKTESGTGAALPANSQIVIHWEAVRA
jgi:hypothetical protein